MSLTLHYPTEMCCVLFQVASLLLLGGTMLGEVLYWDSVSTPL